MVVDCHDETITTTAVAILKRMDLQKNDDEHGNNQQRMTFQKADPLPMRQILEAWARDVSRRLEALYSFLNTACAARSADATQSGPETATGLIFTTISLLRILSRLRKNELRDLDSLQSL